MGKVSRTQALIGRVFGGKASNLTPAPCKVVTAPDEMAPVGGYGAGEQHRSDVVVVIDDEASNASPPHPPPRPLPGAPGAPSPSSLPASYSTTSALAVPSADGGAAAAADHSAPPQQQRRPRSNSFIPASLPTTSPTGSKGGGKGKGAGKPLKAFRAFSWQRRRGNAKNYLKLLEKRRTELREEDLEAKPVLLLEWVELIHELDIVTRHGFTSSLGGGAEVEVVAAMGVAAGVTGAHAVLATEIVAAALLRRRHG